MITIESVSVWLNDYVSAWKSYDPEAIRALFSEDARYYHSPYEESPIEGVEAILANWLEDRDQPNIYDAEYRVMAINGNLAVANGRTTYLEADGKTVQREYDNIFVLEFNDAGQCTLFKEWYMVKPGSKN